MKEEIEQKDIHGTEATTRWIHKHRKAAKWLMKIAIVGISSVLYYLRKEEKEIEEEKTKKN